MKKLGSGEKKKKKLPSPKQTKIKTFHMLAKDKKKKIPQNSVF